MKLRIGLTETIDGLCMFTWNAQMVSNGTSQDPCPLDWPFLCLPVVCHTIGKKI